MTDIAKLRARIREADKAGKNAFLDGLEAVALLDALDEAEKHDYRKLTALGVGNGHGSLFVYGGYEVIKATQAVVFAKEKAERECEALQRERDEACEENKRLLSLLEPDLMETHAFVQQARRERDEARAAALEEAAELLILNRGATLVEAARAIRKLKNPYEKGA